ncbi:MAG: RelA/SpoT family protein [Candidatus Uhrbacteria bacterium]
MDQRTEEYRERLIDEAQSTLSPEDVAVIESAANFAIIAHGEQRRLSGLPYVTHPLETARKLAAMHLPHDVVVAGVLHDTHEDAGVPLAEIEQRFGADVARLVDGVTKVGKVKYRGEERYAENLRKMFVALADDLRVMFIKFADRLHNLEDLAVVPEPKRTRIAREALEIYAPIANRLGMGEIKGKLEDLSFPYLYPKESAWVESLIASRRKHQHLLGEIRDVAVRLFEEQKIAVLAIDGRMKHRYSLYLKLLRYNRDITEIYDLLALRIIVPTVADCYNALSVIHRRWEPLKGRIKDYISNPKPNGYRSIHTTVTCAHGDTFEFQIRTMEMHEEAEWGAAAAWRYHERGNAKLPEHQLRWVDDLIRWIRKVHDPKELIEGLRTEVLRDRILVFTPKGDVIDLPDGATAVDFAYHIHTDIGNRTIAARVNGSTALYPLDRPLQSGDIVEIVTDPKRCGPSPEWPGSVKTAHARRKINNALRGSVRSKLAGWLARATPKRSRNKPQG